MKDILLKLTQLNESVVSEDYTDFANLTAQYEKNGAKVDGKEDDYVVTFSDGTRKRYQTSPTGRKVTSMPAKNIGKEDDLDEGFGGYEDDSEQNEENFRHERNQSSVADEIRDMFANRSNERMGKKGVEEATTPEVDMDKWMKQYRDNEQDNYHSENLVKLAELVGDEDDIELAKKLLADRNKAGYADSETSKKGYELHKVLMPLARKKYEDFKMSRRLNEDFVEFMKVKSDHKKLGNDVDGNEDKYVVTFKDGTRKQYEKTKTGRKVTTLPPKKNKQDLDEDAQGFQQTQDAYKKLGATVTGNENDYTVSMPDGEKKRYTKVGQETKITQLSKPANSLPNVSDVQESAAPGQEDWIKANKQKFIDQYGKKKGLEVLYSTAWKRSKTNEASDDSEEGDEFGWDVPEKKTSDNTRKVTGSYGSEYYKKSEKDDESKNLTESIKSLEREFHSEEMNDIKAVASGSMEFDDLSKPMQERLFSYYKHQMPYGVAKGTHGDPDQWISNELSNEFSELSEEDLLVANPEVTIYVADPFGTLHFKEKTNDYRTAELAKKGYLENNPKLHPEDVITNVVTKKHVFGEEDGAKISDIPAYQRKASGENFPLTKDQAMPKEELFVWVLPQEGEDNFSPRRFFNTPVGRMSAEDFAAGVNGRIKVSSEDLSESADYAMLDELAALAGVGVTESCGCEATPTPQQPDNINVSSVYNSMDDQKVLSVNAEGGKAEQLMQLLKLSGLLTDVHSSSSEDSVEMVDDIVAVESEEKEYSNEPDEEVMGTDVIINQGTDLNRQKRQHADKPRLGDNPLASENIKLDEKFEAALNAIITRK